MLWDEKVDTVAAIIYQALTVIQDWNQARSLIQDPVTSIAQFDAQLQWQPPLLGFVKCNADAAFFSSGDKCGFGMCLRDNLGVFMLAKSHWRAMDLTVRKGEAFALLLAIKWSQSLRLQQVIFETDCKSVADSFNSAALDVSEF